MKDAAGTQDTFRSALRNGTRASHEQTDAAFSKLDLTTREGLGVYLLAQDLALAEVEPLLRNEQGLPVLPSRRHLIEDDLKALGIERSDDALHFPSVLNSLGVAYVVGGSHLGGRVLQKRWSRSEDVQVLSAHRFVASDELRHYWNDLQTVLQNVPSSDKALQEAFQSANATFDHFRHALHLAQQQMLPGG